MEALVRFMPGVASFGQQSAIVVTCEHCRFQYLGEAFFYRAWWNSPISRNGQVGPGGHATPQQARFLAGWYGSLRLLASGTCSESLSCLHCVKATVYPEIGIITPLGRFDVVAAAASAPRAFFVQTLRVRSTTLALLSILLRGGGQLFLCFAKS